MRKHSRSRLQLARQHRPEVQVGCRVEVYRHQATGRKSYRTDILLADLPPLTNVIVTLREFAGENTVQTEEKRLVLVRIVLLRSPLGNLS